MSDMLERENKLLFGIQNKYLLIALVFVIFFTGWGAGIRQRANLPHGQDVLDDLLALSTTDEEWTPRRDGYERSTITIDFEIDESDWQAGGAPTSTNSLYSYFYDEPTEGDTGIGITLAGEYITVKAENDGVIWMDCYGGDDEYLVDSVIRGSNVEILATKIVDWDGDDELDYLVKLDLSRFLMEDFQYKPTYVMEFPLMDMDVTTHAPITVPADQAAIGNTRTTVTVTWPIAGVDAEDGYAISEMYILTNDTAKGVDVECKQLTISGTTTLFQGSSTLQPIHTSVGGAYAAYYIMPSDSSEPLDPDNLIIFRDTNMGDTIYFSVQIVCTFEGPGDGATIDLVYTLVDPNRGTQIEQDQMLLDCR